MSSGSAQSSATGHSGLNRRPYGSSIRKIKVRTRLKRPQQVHAVEERWAEISWAKRCQHPQHAIEQSFDPHNRALYRQEDRGHDAHGEGQQLLHQSKCVQSHAAPVGAETPSLAPSGPLGSAKQCATVFTEVGKTFADCENAGTARHLRRRITGPSCARVPPVRRRKSCSRYAGAVLDLDHRFTATFRIRIWHFS